MNRQQKMGSTNQQHCSPVTRVDAANLIRALQQLEVIAKRQAPRIAFKAKGRILFLNLAEIVAVQAEGNYVSLRHRPNPYLLRESLSSMAEKTQALRFYSHPPLGHCEYFGCGGDPTFTDGRVQAAGKRWEGILGNAHYKRSTSEIWLNCGWAQSAFAANSGCPVLRVFCEGENRKCQREVGVITCPQQNQ